MRLQSLFHLSFYGTLALAAVSLTAPSVFFLWWMPYFLAAAITFFYLAWRYEGVWVLSETAANQLGVFIAIGAAGWILLQVPRSAEQLAAGGVNWPAGLLPHLGPLLMILLTVKLFRPKRQPDYWVIQTMGLMMVALAAVLADDRLFGIMVVLYFASLVWSLGLYYHVRELALVNTALPPHRIALFEPNAAADHAMPWRLLGLPRVALWTAVVASLGFVLFLCAPRQVQSQWNARQLATGPASSRQGSSDAGIDLNRVGHVELSDAPAFTVTLRDHQGKSIDPARIKHWRQETLEIYAQGRWYPQRRIKESVTLANGVQPSPEARPAPAQLAENQWLVSFQVKPSDAGGLVLAEPVDFELGAGLDPRADDKPQPFGFFATSEGWDTFMSSAYPGRRKVYRYSQVIRAQAEPHLTPARGVNEAFFAASLAKYPVPTALAGWTRDLLQRLEGLDDADRQLNDRQQLPLSSHAKVAQALCNHLALSGEYRYSLELRRHDPSLDPTIDFLFHVKEGHCERYAGGLALMLRTLGVRCRVVKGYLGAELDEHGVGIVRRNQAHSWVQALVPGPGEGELQWLTLDPMPAAMAPAGVLASWWNWCKDNLFDTRLLWRQFILEYTPDQQLDLLESLQRLFTSKHGWVMLILLACAATLLAAGPRLGRRLRACWARLLGSGSGSDAGAVEFFDELLHLLRRHGNWTLQLGQTPRELADQIRLGLAPHSGVVADAVGRIVALYYRVRFGGAPLDQLEQAEIRQALGRLRLQLKPASA